MSIAILIPAYRPDEKMINLIRELRPAFTVAVVDDGSGEAYADMFSQAESAGATVLYHEMNRGKGAAIKTGIRYFMEQGNTQGLITADADGQHTPDDIGSIALAMEAHPNTLILGGRDFSQMPSRSRFGNKLTRFFFRLCTGLRISDTQTGLRGLPRSLFVSLAALDGDRYEYEMNMLLALKEWKAPWLEIPIQTVYLDNNSSSHFHALRDGWRVFSRVIKYAAASLGCMAVDYLLYALLLLFLPPAASYAAARIASASLNYEVNCRMVFQGTPSWKNAGGYALLALASLAVGAGFVAYLTHGGMNGVLAKFAIDCGLFAVNYFVQKHLIFRRAGRC